MAQFVQRRPSGDIKEFKKRFNFIMRTSLRLPFRRRWAVPKWKTLFRNENFNKVAINFHSVCWAVSICAGKHLNISFNFPLKKFNLRFTENHDCKMSFPLVETFHVPLFFVDVPLVIKLSLKKWSRSAEIKNYLVASPGALHWPRKVFLRLFHFRLLSVQTRPGFGKWWQSSSQDLEAKIRLPKAKTLGQVLSRIGFQIL